MKINKLFDRYCIIAAIIQSVGFFSGVYLSGINIPESQASAVTTPEISFSILPIFWHNLSVIMFMISGVILLGFPAIMTLFYSGIPLGGLVINGVNLWLVIPHAIVEFPALWLAGSIGIRIPHEFMKYVLNYKDSIIDESIISRVKFQILAIISLIFIAAVIEVIVTPKIYNYFTG